MVGNDDQEADWDNGNELFNTLDQEIKEYNERNDIEQRDSGIRTRGQFI